MSASQTTRIQLCGALSVELEGRRIEDLGGRQGRLLLGYLVTNRLRPVGRDELHNVLWPGHAPDGADASLSAVLSRLRKGLGDGALVGRSDLGLALPGNPWVDLEVAMEHCHRAESAVAREDWPRGWVSSRIALHVTRRVFLAGYDGDWIDERRRHLGALHLSALECVGESALALGGAELAAADRSARELIELDRYRESGYRLMMRALRASGNVAAALAVYEDARQVLRRDLGVAPSPETQALHRELLAGV